MQHGRTVHLCFHGIGRPPRSVDDDEAEHWVGTDLFLRTLDQIADFPATALSFDDGNESDVEVALPALLERNLTASFFPLAGRLTTPGSVDIGGVRKLADAGMHVGTHGMHHVPWAGMTPSQAHEELVTARQAIGEASGRPVTTAACPFGLYDRTALRRLRARGYATVYTSDRAPARPDAWLQPRYSVKRSNTADEVRQLLEPSRSLRGSLVSSARLAVKRWR